MSNGLVPAIWIQNVCKGYQQMKKVVSSKERVKDTLDSQNKACNVFYFVEFRKPLNGYLYKQ